MTNTISIKDLKNKKEKTKSTEKYYERFERAIREGFDFKFDQYEYKNKKHIFHFNDIIMLNNNDILRIHYKKSYKYRALWKERVQNIINTFNVKKNIKTPIIVEALYVKKSKKILDYDASIACLKYIIDGIEKEGLIENDNQKHIPLILTKTIVKPDAEYDSLSIMITEINQGDEDDFYTPDFKKLF